MKLTKAPGGSPFRKIAMGSWATVGDPSVYGLLEIDMTNILSLIEKLKGEGHKVGISEFVGRAAALVLKERPEMNGMLKRGRIYLRHSVNLFFQVNVPGDPADPVCKATLLGLTIPDAETKGLLQINTELRDKARKVKSGEDKQMMTSVKNLTWLPWQLMRPVLNLASFLNYDLNLPLHLFGMPKDSFGSVMITNVGSLGIETAWAPLVPYTRVPLLLAVGSVRDRAWVVNGRVEVRPIMRIGCTFDHRFMDGVHAAAMSKLFNKYFENPELLL